MTKTLVEIYREKVEEFGRLAKSVKARIEQQKTPNEEGANKALKILTNELNSLTLAILKAELERVEGMKKEPELEPSDIHESGQLVGYNAAITDHAKYIKSQIKEIEGI